MRSKIACFSCVAIVPNYPRINFVCIAYLYKSSFLIKYAFLLWLSPLLLNVTNFKLFSSMHWWMLFGVNHWKLCPSYITQKSDFVVESADGFPPNSISITMLLVYFDFWSLLTSTDFCISGINMSYSLQYPDCIYAFGYFLWINCKTWVSIMCPIFKSCSNICLTFSSVLRVCISRTPWIAFDPQIWCDRHGTMLGDFLCCRLPCFLPSLLLQYDGCQPQLFHTPRKGWSRWCHIRSDSSMSRCVSSSHFQILFTQYAMECISCVLIGLGKVMDLPIEWGWDEVTITNLKKIDAELGTVLRDDHGKIMKPLLEYW